MGGHTFNPTLLRRYDIRGIVGETLSVDDAVALGRTYGSIVAKTAASLFVLAGMAGSVLRICWKPSSSGLNGIRYQCCGYRARRDADALLCIEDAGCARGDYDHRFAQPAELQRFQIGLANSPFWADQIQQLGKRSTADDWIEGQGENRLPLGVLDAYVSRLCRDYRSDRELKVVWDAGNASVGPAVVELARRLPGHHVVLNETVDGTFPAHHPDPTMPENLRPHQFRDRYGL